MYFVGDFLCRKYIFSIDILERGRSVDARRGNQRRQVYTEKAVGPGSKRWQAADAPKIPTYTRTVGRVSLSAS